MRSVVCFGRLAVLVEALSFLDPDPGPDQEGPERGVRVELRVLADEPHRGSVYASQRIVVDRALWRCDLLESVAGGPGSADRMHHHPVMHDDEPGDRVFDPALGADPIPWLERRLAGTDRLLEDPAVDTGAVSRGDVAELLASLPQVLDLVATTLARVRTGELATAPS